MPNCTQCGAPLPTSSFGELKTICATCEGKAAAGERAPSALAIRSTRVTTGLIAVNVAVFAAMVARGVSPVDPSGLDIMKWGADYGPLTLSREPWRLLSSMFIHIGIVHLLLNMWCLWSLGRIAESVFGRRAYLLIYIAAGVCGAYFSLAWNPLRASAGASGAIFGVAGALIAAFKFGKLPIDPQELRKTLKSVLSFAAYNLFIGLGGSIDNTAHIGGLVGGLAVGFVFARLFPPESERYGSAFKPTLLAAGILIVAGFFGLQAWKAEAVTFGQAELAVTADDCATALPLLEKSVTARPESGEVHRYLGYCHEKAGRFTEAQQEYERAIALDPSDDYSSGRLASVYVHNGNAPKALPILRALVSKDPDNLEDRLTLAHALIAVGQVADAEPELKRVLQQDPERADAWSALADVYRSRSDFPQEVAARQTAARLQPDMVEYHRSLADALARSGDAKGAARERASADRLAAQQPPRP